MQWLADWWDGVELWVVGLWFPLQFVLAMVVLLPLALGLGWVITRGVDYLFGWLGTRSRRTSE